MAAYWGLLSFITISIHSFIVIIHHSLSRKHQTNRVATNLDGIANRLAGDAFSAARKARGATTGSVQRESAFAVGVIKAPLKTFAESS